MLLRYLLAAAQISSALAHGHLMDPNSLPAGRPPSPAVRPYRTRAAVGRQIRGYYVYWPFQNYAPGCVQGHCFGPTSFRCKDLAAEQPSLQLVAGTQLTLTVYYQAFHPGDCSVYISYDADKVAPIHWLALAHMPGCAGGPDRILTGPTTLSFNVTLPSWLATCSHCVLRWEWTAVHQPAAGPQQYLDCVDVSVVGTTSDTADVMLRRVHPIVNITTGSEHLRGNGVMRFPYGARRQFGLQYMGGGQMAPGGSLAVATLINPTPPLPPPSPGTSTTPPPPPAATCADDPTYIDVYTCASWSGFACRNGGWGITGAARINALVAACPVACADVSCPGGASSPPPPPPPPPHVATATLASNGRSQPQTLTGVCDQPAFSSRSSVIVNNRQVACSVLLDVPSSCARSSTSSSSDPSCPIVFFFHGSGGNSMNHFWRTRDIIHTTGSSQQPLIGIFPQGAGNVWNTAGQSNVDDMAFILAIVTRLRVMGATGRLYAFGSSNGAALAQRIGTNGGMGFTGIIPSATQLSSSPERSGPSPHDYNYPTVGSSTRAIAVLMLHGSADTTIPVGGGRLFFTSTYLSSTVQSIQLWAHVGGCTGLPTVSSMSATYGGGASTTTTTATLTAFNCPYTTPVEYVETRCAGHGGAASINGIDTMQYVAGFVHRVESACDTAGSTGQGQQCDNPMSYTPSSATVWPVYTAPSCTDTAASCACTPSTTTTWMPLPSGSSAHSPPPPPPALSQCPAAPLTCSLTAYQMEHQKCACSYRWDTACGSEPVAAELRCE